MLNVLRQIQVFMLLDLDNFFYGYAFGTIRFPGPRAVFFIFNLIKFAHFLYPRISFNVAIRLKLNPLIVFDF